MSERSNSILHLVVAEDIDGISSGIELLTEIGLESLNNQPDFDVAIGRERLLGRVVVGNHSHLHAPVSYDYHFVL